MFKRLYVLELPGLSRYEPDHLILGEEEDPLASNDGETHPSDDLPLPFCSFRHIDHLCSGIPTMHVSAATGFRF